MTAQIIPWPNTRRLCQIAPQQRMACALRVAKGSMDRQEAQPAYSVDKIITAFRNWKMDKGGQTL